MFTERLVLPILLDKYSYQKEPLPWCTQFSIEFSNSYLPIIAIIIGTIVLIVSEFFGPEERKISHPSQIICLSAWLVVVCSYMASVLYGFALIP